MSEINIDVKLMVDSLQRASKDAQKSLLGIQSAAKKTNEGIEKGAKRSASAWATFRGVIGAAVVVGGFRAIASASSNMVKSFVAAAGTVEDISAEFTSLTGSAQNAQKLLADLSKFAANTPFQLTGLAAASKTLLAFGISQSEIIDRLRIIGDVSAVTGKDIKELSVIFGQVAAAGKLTGERLNQLQESGVPVLKALADQLGVTQGAVRELVTQGRIDFATFQKAFDTLNKEGGVAFKGLENRSKTLNGILSTLADNIFEFQASVGKELVPTIKDAANEFIVLIQGNKDLATEFAKSTIENAIAGFEGLVKTMRALAPVVRGVSSILGGMFNIIKSLHTAIGVLVDVALVAAGALTGAFALALDGVNEFVEGISSAMEAVANTVPRLAASAVDSLAGFADSVAEAFGGNLGASESVKEFTDSLKEVEESTEESGSSIKSLANTVDDFGKSLFETGVQSLSKTFTPAVKEAEEAVKSLDKVSKGATSKIDSEVTQSIDLEGTFDGFIADFSDGINNLIDDLPDSIKDGFATGVDILSKAIASGDPKSAARGAVIGSAVAGINALAPGAGDVAKPFLEAAAQGKEQARAFTEEFVKEIPVVIEAIVDALPVIIETLIANLPQLFGAVSKGLVELVTSGRIVAAIASGIHEAFLTIGDEIQLIGRQIGTAFTQPLVQFVDDFYKEIIRGLDGFAQAVGELFRNVFAGFAGPITDLLNVVQFLQTVLNDINNLVQNFFNSVKFGFAEVANTIGDIFKRPLEELKNAVREIVELLDFDVPGTGGSSATDLATAPIRSFGRVLGLATGGQVIGAGTRDTVPALLTPGEIVIDRTTGPRLNKFLDSAEAGGASNQQVVALLGQVVQALQNPQAAQVSLSVDGNVLADQILELSRNNARLG
jgi:tape measure domain-containing protein